MADWLRDINDWLNSLTADDLEPFKMPAAIAFVVMAGIMWIALRIWEKRRRESLARQAAKLGLQFKAERDYDLPGQLQFLSRFDEGVDRYAFNIMQGAYRGHPVRCFDYHYAIKDHDTGSRRDSAHFYFSVFVLHQPVAFPELEIYPQRYYHRIGQAFGMETINFESPAFNKAFVVRAANRRFAYDVCHPQMMTFLLQNPDINLEIEAHCIAIRYDERQKVDEVQPHLDVLVGIRELMPKHLYAE